MYTVAVKRDFVGQHFLIGGDWGAENFWHSHHYVVEVQLEGEELDKHGYLTDITDIEHNLEKIVEGDMAQVTDALVAHNQAELLKGEEE